MVATASIAVVLCSSRGGKCNLGLYMDLLDENCVAPERGRTRVWLLLIFVLYLSPLAIYIG